MGLLARIHDVFRKLRGGRGGAQAERPLSASEGSAPVVATRPLPDDLLQFAGQGARATTDIVVGLDFGTSCCKVALQSPYKLDGRVAFAEFGKLAHPVSEFYLPSTLYEGADGCLGLRETGPTRLVHRHLKIGLLGDQAQSQDEATIRAATYLGLVLREVRRFFLSTQGEIYGADRLRWSLNLGIPSAGYDDAETRRRFRLVAEAAWRLSLSAARPTLEAAQLRLEQRANTDDVVIDVVPEVAAQVVGYAKSRQRQDGLHLLLDVGASTLDLCAFSLHNTEGEDGYALLTADVQPLGLLELHRRRAEATGNQPPFAGIPVDLVAPLPDWNSSVEGRWAAGLRTCDAAFAEAARKVLWRSLADLRRSRDPHSPRWKEGLPLFVCGGGSGSRVVDEARKAADRTGKGIWDPYAGLRVMNLPVPLRSIASASHALDRMDFARLSVAYGLSFPAINIGKIEPPAAIDDVASSPPPPDWKSRYIDK